MHENMKNFCCSLFLLMNIFSCLSPLQAEAACRNPNIVKLPAHRAGLPGKVISFYIVPLDPAHSAGLAGHVPVNKEGPSIVPAVASGLIEIRWFGHAFFQITSSMGTRIITEKGGMEEALSALA